MLPVAALVRFPAPTLWLTTICNCTYFQGARCSLPAPVGTALRGTQPYTGQHRHTWIIIIIFKRRGEKEKLGPDKVTQLPWGNDSVFLKSTFALLSRKNWLYVWWAQADCKVRFFLFWGSQLCQDSLSPQTNQPTKTDRQKGLAASLELVRRE